MGRKSIKEIRQQEIVRAFYKKAKEEGLHNTSIAKIAEYMDVNPSLILHYYKSKDELILALIDYILNRYLKIYQYDKNADPLTQLHQVLEKLFTTKWDTLISDDVYYSCYTLIFRDPVVKQKYKELHDSLRASLKEHLIHCVEQKLIQLEDPELTANLVYTVLDGVYYYLCMESDEQKSSQMLAQCKSHAYSIIGIKEPSI